MNKDKLSKQEIDFIKSFKDPKIQFLAWLIRFRRREIYKYIAIILGFISITLIILFTCGYDKKKGIYKEIIPLEDIKKLRR